MGWPKDAIFTISLCTAWVALDHAALVVIPNPCRTRRTARADGTPKEFRQLPVADPEERDPDDPPGTGRAVRGRRGRPGPGMGGPPCGFRCSMSIPVKRFDRLGACIAFVLALAACGGAPSPVRGEGPPAAASSGAAATQTPARVAAGATDGIEEEFRVGEKIERTEAQWRAMLTPEQYRIAREKGTEMAFTGKYWDTKDDGVYHCIGCGLALFRSDAKFDSGCGWPSFFEPLEGARITETVDETLGMVRTEITCSRCDSHLGHVFDDGPAPTGLRYCVNSASVNLAPAKDSTPEK